MAVLDHAYLNWVMYGCAGSCMAVMRPLMEGTECHMSISRNGNVACVCHLFSSMSHAEFKKFKKCPWRSHPVDLRIHYGY